MSIEGTHYQLRDGNTVIKTITCMNIQHDNRTLCIIQSSARIGQYCNMYSATWINVLDNNRMSALKRKFDTCLI